MKCVMNKRILKTNDFARGHLALMTAAALASGVANADFIAEMHVQDEAGQHQATLTMESTEGPNGRMSRLNVHEASYMLIRDGKAYMVTNFEIPVAMDLSELGQTDESGQTEPVSLGANEIADVISLESTGGNEIVAAISGEIYKMRWRDGEGREHLDEIVLSGDPRALELLHAQSHLAAAMNAAGFHNAGQAELMSLLEGKNMGWLRIGSRSRITSFEQTALSPERFALPGSVMELPLGQESSNDEAEAVPAAETAGADEAEEESGGFFGGLFGKKVERQSERQQERAGKKVDEEAYTAVDRAVDKVFDSLFGD